MYKLKQVSEKIFAVIVPNKYDLGMLFCRVQEFYESPNKKFKNNKFSIWDYYEWYSKNNSGCFSYVKDYCGYNVPFDIAKECYKLNKIETPYDKIFIEILKNINLRGSYVIGIDRINNSTFFHEFCHGLYYVNSSYRKEMDDITKKISKINYQKFKNNLKQKGYCSAVTDDEIQAYMSTEVNMSMTKGIANKSDLHKKYKKVFQKYK